MSGTMPWWVIEASRDGIVFDSDTFVHGSRQEAERLAERLQNAHQDGWIPGVTFEVKPLARGDLAERILA